MVLNYGLGADTPTRLSERLCQHERFVSPGRNGYTIVSESLEMTAPGGLLKTESYLIGSSADGVRTWTFIDGAGVGGNPAMLRKALPQFPASIITLPATRPSVFEPGA